MHAHAGTRVHEATSLTGLVPERVQLTVHTTEPTRTVPEPFHCDHIARWSARSRTSGRSGTGLNTGNWNGSGTVLVSNLWCEPNFYFRNVFLPRVDKFRWLLIVLFCCRSTLSIVLGCVYIINIIHCFHCVYIV